MDVNSIKVVHVLSKFDADSILIDSAIEPVIFQIGALNPSVNRNLIAYTIRISLTAAGGHNNLLLPGQTMIVRDAFAPSEPIPISGSGLTPNNTRTVVNKDYYKRNQGDLQRCEKVEAANQNGGICFAVEVKSGKVAVREFLFTGVYEYNHPDE